MIEVKVSTKHGMICGFHIEGHACSTLCSAVSALSINTVNTLATMAEVEYTKEPEDLDGFMSFEVKNFGKKEVSMFLLSLNLGLRSISKEYPYSLTLAYEDVEVVDVKSPKKDD